LLGTPSPLSTRTPQIGSYDLLETFFPSPEFTAAPWIPGPLGRPPPAFPSPAPEAGAGLCKRGAAPSRHVRTWTLRHRLPRLGTGFPIPGAGGVLAGRRPDDARRLPAARPGDQRAVAQQLGRTGPRGRLLRDGVVLRTERGLRPQQETRAQEQRARGLAGEEEPSHSRRHGAPGAPTLPRRAPG